MELNSLVSQVSLTDILSQPTEQKEVNKSSDEFINEDDFANEVIEDDIQEDEFISDQLKREEEEDEDYDAESEAKKLVGLLSAMNSLVVTPVAHWKLRKNIGGKKTLDRMKNAYQKNVRGDELNEREQKLLAAFQSYKKDMEILSGEIPYSDHEIETLNKLAVPYLNESKMKISGAGSFWTVFGGMQISKIVKVLMS